MTDATIFFAVLALILGVFFVIALVLIAVGVSEE